jgi:hypothetical protein
MSSIEEMKCQTIYQNLIMCHESRRKSPDVTASAFVRELQETSRCDKYNNFEDVRRDLHNRVSSQDPNIMKRVFNFKQTQEDEEVVAQACLHYHKWHENKLVSALSWPNWIYYQTVERGERTLATLGIFGAGYGGMKVVRSSFRQIKALKKK